jgi:RNA 2',3'-cyclic 3'-phosphodiesterase
VSGGGEDREEARRLFVGIRVSVGTSNALAGAVETLARRAGNANLAVRWLSPTLYHVTLKFLGWTQPEAISALRDALREAVRGVEPFSFQAARLGAFPSLDRARVVWAGVSARGEVDALAGLARRVDLATAELGFVADKPFAGHITLGRLAEPTAISEVLLPLMEQVFSDTKATGISLLESTLKSGGLAYREVAHFGFLPSENGRKRQSPSLQLGQQNAPSSSDPSYSSSEIETDDGWPRGHGP